MIKRSATALLLLAGSAQADPLAGLYEIPLGHMARMAEAEPMALTHPLRAGFPESLEGRPDLSVRLHVVEGALVADVIQTGVLDDSIEGEHHRLILTQLDDGLWAVDAMGVRYRCRRGDQAGVWGARSCP